MDKQNLDYYIEQLELLRELEGQKLILREVAAKHQDRIVTEMLQTVSGKTTLENEIEVASSSHDHIFISYSHKDKRWLQKLHLFFAPLIRQEKIHFWSDSQIIPGATWREEIQDALKNAKIALLLVSPHFLASDFIAKYELPPLLSAAKQRGLIILWIAVSASMYTETEIAKYQALNNPSKPLDSFKPSQVHQELVHMCEHIKRIIETS